jgi:hypothetical protein
MNTFMKGLKDMMNSGKKPVADQSPSDSLLEKKGQKEGNPEAGKVEKNKEKHPQDGIMVTHSWDSSPSSASNGGKKEEHKGEKVGTIVNFYKGKVEAHDPSNSPTATNPGIEQQDEADDATSDTKEASGEPLPAIVVKGFDKHICQLFVLDPEGAHFVKAHFSESPKDRHWTHSK